MYTKQHIITSFIIGILLSITVGATYMYYQVSKQTIQNTQAIQQIVGFINSNMQQPK